MSGSDNQLSVLPEYAASVVQKIFGKNSTKVNQITQGVMTFKFMVELPQEEIYIVRFYPPSRSSVINYEPDILRRCNNVGIPVPKVISESRRDPTAPMQYIVYKMIDGIPLSQKLTQLSTSDNNKLAAQLVSYLYKLKDICVSGYGDLINSKQAQYNSWHEFIETSLREGLRVGERYGLIKENMMTALKKIVRKVEIIPTRNMNSLTWGDISPENILINNHNKIKGLIDFEGVLASDVFLNLGYCYAGYYNTDFFKSLQNAWPDPITEKEIKRIKLYAILKALRIIKFAHQPLPTGHSRISIDRLLPGLQTAIETI